MGTPCSFNNQGDPFTLYDPIADRWLISDFALGTGFPGDSFWECIGVSQTNDPVSGGWFLYALQVDLANPDQFGDYPKFAMWNSGGSPAQNAYFLTVDLWTDNQTFKGVRVFALDRAAMLAGTGRPNPMAIAFTIPPAGLGASQSLLGANFRNGSCLLRERRRSLTLTPRLGPEQGEGLALHRLARRQFNSAGQDHSQTPRPRWTVCRGTERRASAGYFTKAGYLGRQTHDARRLPKPQRHGIAMGRSHCNRERGDRDQLVSIRCYRRQFPCHPGATATLDQWQRWFVALDAQCSCRCER